MTSRCPLCGCAVNDDEASVSSICHRCKSMGGKVRLEIYDGDSGAGGKPDPFSDAFLGKMNYRRLRNTNLKRGGY